MLDTDEVAIHLVLDRRSAQSLWEMAMEEFVLEQEDRFEWDHGECPHEDRWRGGTFFWCRGGADMLLLEAYERACGHDAMRLGDLADIDPDMVVLSTRRWGTYGSSERP